MAQKRPVHTTVISECKADIMALFLWSFSLILFTFPHQLPQQQTESSLAKGRLTCQTRRLAYTGYIIALNVQGITTLTGLHHLSNESLKLPSNGTDSWTLKHYSLVK